MPYRWSTTSANNATADATINWAEGQAPSSVNDSARAMMTRIKKLLKDLGAAGLGATAGTSTAYTYTSNIVFPDLATMDGATIALQFHTASGASPTLNVDGLGAKVLIGVGGAAIAAGNLQATTPYFVTYSNSLSAWMVHGKPGYLDAPQSTAMLFNQTAAPTGWTKDATAYNHALRVTGGTITSGGSVDFTTLFGRTGTDAVTLVTGNIPLLNFSLSVGTSITGETGQDSPDHTHSTNTGGTTVQSGAGASINAGGPIASGGASVRHTHNQGTLALASGAVGGSIGQSSPTTFTPAIDMRVKWLEVIRATKA